MVCVTFVMLTPELMSENSLSCPLASHFIAICRSDAAISCLIGHSPEHELIQPQFCVYFAFPLVELSSHTRVTRVKASSSHEPRKKNQTHA